MWLFDKWFKKIVNIKITDPNIYLYGLSINSPFDEIVSVMEKHSFTVTVNSNPNYIRAEYGKYTFTFSNDRIYIGVEVTNRFGIILAIIA